LQERLHSCTPTRHIYSGGMVKTADSEQPFRLWQEGESFRLYQGNALELLQSLTRDSIHCCVTSPPYWNLRNYGVTPQVWGGDPNCTHRWEKERYYDEGGGPARSEELFTQAGDENAQRLKRSRWKTDERCSRCHAWRGSLGLEPTITDYVEHLVYIFREVKRVHREDGTVWLNLGDRYFRPLRAGWRTGGNGSVGKPAREPSSMVPTGGLKAKDLVGLPWRVALALQADDWYVRSEVIWHKPNGIPESVTDRPTRCHEHLFLLTKRPRYFYDAEAIREPLKAATLLRERSGKGRAIMSQVVHSLRPEATGEKKPWHPLGDGRNKPSVWTFSPSKKSLDHPATFPERLVEPCVRAGTSERGCCPSCGAPWKRIVERQGPQPAWQRACGGSAERKRSVSKDVSLSGKLDPMALKERILNGLSRRVTVGWEPTCACPRLEPVPCVVLDPFCGSGTVGAVALSQGRKFIGIDLNAQYLLLTKSRLDRVLHS
jgi:DNA modification methylase